MRNGKFENSKKIFLGLVFITVLFMNICLCTAASIPRNPLEGTVDNVAQGAQLLVAFILRLIGSISLLVIIIAGLMYITSAGNEQKIESSKKILTSAATGLVIAVLAYGFLKVIIEVLNMI